MVVAKKKVKGQNEIGDQLAEALKDLRSNPEAEEEGRWFSFEDDTGREVLVAWGGNSKFRAKLARKTRPHMHKLRKRNAAAVELQLRLSGQAMSGTILKDWRGGAFDDVRFTEKLGEQILADPEYRPFRERIEEFADLDDEYMELSEEEAAKN